MEHKGSLPCSQQHAIASVLSQMNPGQALPPYFFKVSFPSWAHRPVTNPNCCDSVRSKARGISASSEYTELLAVYRPQRGQQVQLTLSAPRRRLGGVEAQLHSQLISAPDRGEWSTSRPVRLTPRKGARTDGTAGLMDPRVRLEVLCRSEYLLPPSGHEPMTVHPIVQSLYQPSCLTFFTDWTTISECRSTLWLICTNTCTADYQLPGKANKNCSC